MTREQLFALLDRNEAALVAARERIAELEQQLADERGLLDWLEAAPDLNVIEPGGGFPDGLWTIWRDNYANDHYGRGETLRSAIRAAKEGK